MMTINQTFIFSIKSSIRRRMGDGLPGVSAQNNYGSFPQKYMWKDIGINHMY